MSKRNFLRRYTLKGGPMGQTGFEIGNVGSAKETALHICFNIEKSDAETANTAKVQIWNLSDRNLKLLESKDCIIELKAGYEDHIPLVLVGNVTSAVTTSDNADRMTELEVVDGRVALRDTDVSISLNGAVNCKDVYLYIASQMGIPVIFAPDLTHKILPNGFSFVGSARTGLQKLAGCCGHSWSIQHQILQVTWPGRPVSVQGYLLNNDSGLIDVPKRITLAASSGSEEPVNGWEIQYFLNGAIGINDIVMVESPKVSGCFRVQKITMDGDNLEGDWICTAQVLEIQAEPTTGSQEDGAEIKKGDKVKVIRTLEQSGKTKGYQYSGGTFVCWYDVYDVIQVRGDRVVIGIGNTVTAAVNINDLQKV